MAKQLSKQELRQQAVRALSDSLGPVDALRFLALVSREPFDYQQLERLEDAEDLKILKEIRSKPLKFRKLEDFLKEQGSGA
jgi:hypothetical protein